MPFKWLIHQWPGATWMWRPAISSSDCGRTNNLTSAIWCDWARPSILQLTISVAKKEAPRARRDRKIHMKFLGWAALHLLQRLLASLLCCGKEDFVMFMCLSTNSSLIECVFGPFRVFWLISQHFAWLARPSCWAVPGGILSIYPSPVSYLYIPCTLLLPIVCELAHVTTWAKKAQMERHQPLN